MSRITSPIIRHVLLDERRLSYPVSGRRAVRPGVEEREHLAADYLGHAPVGRFSQGFSTRFWFRVFLKRRRRCITLMMRRVEDTVVS